jgi:hypothetical protein
MSTSAVEAFLARLYTDAAAMRRFLASPREEAARAGLSDAECEALSRADMTGLQMAAQSFSHKREGRSARRTWRQRFGWEALVRWVGRQPR